MNKLPRQISRLPRLLIAIAALLVQAACDAHIGWNRSSRAVAMMEYLSRSAQNGLPAALYVSIEGDIIVNAGFGTADRQTEARITPHTLFDAGSLTKQFTAAAILVLKDQNLVGLHSPISDFLQNVPPDKSRITLHQLLTHTSGLSDRSGGFEGRDGDKHLSRAEFLSNILNSPLAASPGSKFEYSNAGYTILAAIIELVSGEDYEVFLRRHLFLPAGMHATGYQKFAWSEENVAIGYRWIFFDERASQPPFLRKWRDAPVSWRLVGNGGLHTTLNDLVLWYRAIEDGGLLSPGAQALFFAPHVLRDFAQDRYYAYGLNNRPTPSGHRSLSHAGSNGVFYAWAYFAPDDDILIVYLTNETHPVRERVPDRLVTLAYGGATQEAATPPLPNHFILDWARENDRFDRSRLLGEFTSTYTGQSPDADTLMLVAEQLIEAELVRQALDVLLLGVELYRDDSLMHFQVANAFRDLGKLTHAREHYAQSIELGGLDCGWCPEAQAELDADAN